MKQKTYHAPAERLDNEEILVQANELKLEENVGRILDALPSISLLLNIQRQIIFCNKAYFRANPKVAADTILGLRPGELLSCMHSRENPGGCGTSESCRYCGAVNAFLECQHTGEQVENEVRILTGEENLIDAMDLKVTASPMKIRSYPYILLTMVDISHEKRRQILERVFFHDLLNKTGSLSCVFENIKLPPGAEKVKNIIEIATNMSNEIVEEINTHKSIMEAEKGELQVSPEKLLTDEVIQAVVKQMCFNSVAYEKNINVSPDTEDLLIFTDYSLLTRVLVNMMKNALEATTREGTVTIVCRKEDDSAVFSVHNSNSMEENIRLQVFQRSFSTKGSNRGLGTYSMKLLGEKYLGGKIWFESAPESGTIFYFKIPMSTSVWNDSQTS